MPALARIRASRAEPPGRAASSNRRRRTYSAALEQFHDLIEAAASVGPAARPLLLFYALSQAGRAIVAANGDDDGLKTRGHGLHEYKIVDPLTSSIIHPTKGGGGLFGVVADVVESRGLSGPVDLGALWSAIPGLPLPPDSHSPPALRVWPLIYEQTGTVLSIGTENRGIVIVPDEIDTPEALTELLRRYPDAAGAEVSVPQGAFASRPTPWGLGHGVIWPRVEGDAGWPVTLAERIPQHRFHREHWLIPTVGDQQDHLLPLMLWWAMLFGLSILARYEPGTWVPALEVDASRLAVPLEEVLESALDAVPHLVYEALVSRQLLLNR